MTQLGLGSYGVAWAVGVPGFEMPAQSLTAVGLVELAHALGLRLVQIADNLPLHALSPQQRRDLQEFATERGVQIEVGTRGIQPHDLDLYLPIAQEFASPILRVVVDTATHHPSPDEVVALLRPVLPRLRDAGIVLALENHDRFKAHTLAGIVQTLDSPQVGICLDTVNSFGALEGPAVVLEALAPYVVNLHVKEFIIRRLSHNMGFSLTGAPAGQGMLDVPGVLATLHQQGRVFNAIIETWLSPQPTPAATVALEMDYVRQSVTYLRTLIPN